PGRAFAIVVKLGLQPRQAVKETVALLPKAFNFGFRGNLRCSLGRLVLRGLLLKAVVGIGRRQFVLGVKLLPFFFVCDANVSVSVGLSHIYSTWSSNWNSFQTFSFSSLSNSCAMYDTAVMVCW